MSVSSKADLLRSQLNLKNLRRHDPLIEEILGSTPYVTVYYNTGADWIKTGIEGPMFLFSRSSTPRYGFFVLNRQGLEYVQEFLTPESEIKVEGDFILYEPHGLADRATGIWIAEEKDRIELCRRMEEIRAASKPLPVPAAAPAAPALPYNQSISLDLLFASSSAPKPTPPALAQATSTNHPTLDMLFASTSPQPAAQTLPIPVASPSASAGISLLDSIFKSAAQTPPPPPPAPVPQAKPNDAAALLAMMGLGSPLSQAQALPQAPPAPQQQQRAPAPPAPAPKSAASAPAPAGISPFAPPLLSHDIFASLPLPGAKKVPSPVVQSRVPPHAQPPPPPPTSHAPLSQAASHPLPAPTPNGPTTTPSSTEQKLAQAIQAEKERIARSISGPPVGLAPASVEGKLAGSLSAAAVAGIRGGQSPSTVNGSPNGIVGAGGVGAAVKVPVKKNVALGVLDEALVARGGLGGGAAGGQVLGQREFVEEVRGLLEKPAFATALYARYLERCEGEE